MMTETILCDMFAWYVFMYPRLQMYNRKKTDSVCEPEGKASYHRSPSVANQRLQRPYAALNLTGA